jgi:Pirin
MTWPLAMRGKAAPEVRSRARWRALPQDSLGNAQLIRPGAVNWLTVGRGIVHSERTTPEL